MSNHNNETFVFDGKTKLFTIVLMVIGAVCLGWSYISGPEDMHHMRFWTNYLHNSVFFTGIAFTAVLFLAAHALAWGGWVAMFKRIPEAIMSFLWVGAILFLILGIAIYMHANGTELLYLWNNQDYLNVESANFDPLAFHKSAFVNPIAYLLTVVVVLAWTFFAVMFRKISINEDSTPYVVTTDNPVPENVRKNRIYAAAFLPIGGFSSAYVIWQWVMSVDTHWYSTLFAWYVTVSMWVAMMAMTFMLIIFLRGRGLLQKFTDEHMHDIGKYIFGFSVFWTYLWFSQFMLIWYANNGEETQYFFIRFEQFKVVFFANLLMNFVGPFFILMMNNSKRTLGTLGFVAGLVFIGHWVDFYQMIKPGVWYNYEHAQHLSHAGHGDHGDTHSENTYHINEAPKAVLTTYQDDQHGHDHGNDHSNGDDVNTNAEHNHDTHTDNHNHDDHATTDAGHDHDDNHGHAAAGHDDHAHGDHAHHAEPQFLLGVHFPGALEIGTMLGFLGLFLFVTFTALSRAPLYPPNDPYILESEHYDTGIGPERDAH
ncbi:hypothetical protein [Aureispira sp. CCB-QB1]|uniref:hypothetical protein n=1 Tax=Aureispira sp. CCB-QB1 TaxID=1313421 RepID=UPI0009DF5BAE|nr:hypothetical protein [Aureispira sp. CCB-QB1]